MCLNAVSTFKCIVAPVHQSIYPHAYDAGSSSNLKKIDNNNENISNNKNAIFLLSKLAP